MIGFVKTDNKKPILVEIARRNSLANLKQNQDKQAPTAKYLTLSRTNADLAKDAEMSHETLRKISTRIRI